MPVHILALMPPNISLSKLLQYIKGKSEYFAVTVGNLNEKPVQEYIKNQQMHHKKDDFSIADD